MAFTAVDFHEFIRLLSENRQWQAELRRLVLTDEFLELPALVRRMAEWQQAMAEEQRALAAEVRNLTAAQARTDKRLDRVEAALAELAAAQARTEKRLEELAAEVRTLAEAQARTDKRLDRVEAALAELAAAQARTEKRLEELAAEVRTLAEAQARTDKRLEELAEGQRLLFEAQARTDKRLDRVEAALAELAAAQARTEKRLEELAAEVRTLAEGQRLLFEAQARTEQILRELSEAHAGLKQEFNRFRDVFGATVEDEAGGVLASVLREKGYRLLGESYNLAVDGEVDVVQPVLSPEGRPLWAVVEAKARLSGGDVSKWARRIKDTRWRRRLAARHVPGPFLVYVFAIRLDRSALEEAEREGIGLLTGQGERIPPKGLIGDETG